MQWGLRPAARHCSSTAAAAVESAQAPAEKAAAVALPTSDESDELLRVRHSVSSSAGQLHRSVWHPDFAAALRKE
jgi:prephenate dehydratase